MSEGTSLEDIELGNVQHSADDAVMNAILTDMNAAEEAPAYIPQYTQPEPPMQPMPQPMQPMPMHQMQYMQHMQPMQPMHPEPPAYERIEEPLKRNTWSTLFDDMRDPLVVGLLVCLFSLPALHTWLAKHLTWAYKVGGSLSWIGFLLQFVLVAGLFATYRQIMTVMNM